MNQMNKKISYFIGAMVAILLVVKIATDGIEPESKKKTVKTEHTTEKVLESKSYWFVVVRDKNNMSMYNTFMIMPTKAFSIEKVNEKFGKSHFIINFVEVSKETFLENEEK